MSFKDAIPLLVKTFLNKTTTTTKCKDVALELLGIIASSSSVVRARVEAAIPTQALYQPQVDKILTRQVLLLIGELAETAHGRLSAVIISRLLVLMRFGLLEVKDLAIVTLLKAMKHPDCVLDVVQGGGIPVLAGLLTNNNSTSLILDAAVRMVRLIGENNNHHPALVQSGFKPTTTTVKGSAGITSGLQGVRSEAVEMESRMGV